MVSHNRAAHYRRIGKFPHRLELLRGGYAKADRNRQLSILAQTPHQLTAHLLATAAARR